MDAPKRKKNGAKTLETQIAELEEKVKRNDNRMAQMYTDKLDGIISVEEFTKYRESYQKESQDIEKRIEILKSKLVALSGGETKTDTKSL